MSGRETNKVVEYNIGIYKCEKTETPAMKEALAFLGCKVSSYVKNEDITLFIGDVVNLRILKKGTFSPRKGWNFPEVNIPLHN